MLYVSVHGTKLKCSLFEAQTRKSAHKNITTSRRVMFVGDGVNALSCDAIVVILDGSFWPSIYPWRYSWFSQSATMAFS
jgi:hypothetical protein